MKEALIQELDRVEEDSLYSAKGHWETARTCESLHFLIGVPATVSAAAAGAMAFGDCIVATSFLSMAAAVLTALLTFFDPNSRAAQHRVTGNRYKALSNDARIARATFGTLDSDVVVLSSVVSALNSRRSELNEASPLIGRRAFQRAKKGIEAGEGSYRADTKPTGRRKTQ